ncbi:MAG: hypothetical protein LBD99_04940 [Candidatus Margulisbacteria bacterium]|jgi:hypothetical protein|nr:hypothetical protein [Candidatus Margulisiibacteriota bacterium]
MFFLKLVADAAEKNIKQDASAFKANLEALLILLSGALAAGGYGLYVEKSAPEAEKAAPVEFALPASLYVDEYSADSLEFSGHHLQYNDGIDNAIYAMPIWGHPGRANVSFTDNGQEIVLGGMTLREPRGRLFGGAGSLEEMIRHTVDLSGGRQISEIAEQAQTVDDLPGANVLIFTPETLPADWAALMRSAPHPVYGDYYRAFQACLKKIIWCPNLRLTSGSSQADGLTALFDEDTDAVLINDHFDRDGRINLSGWFLSVHEHERTHQETAAKAERGVISSLNIDFPYVDEYNSYAAQKIFLLELQKIHPELVRETDLREVERMLNYYRILLRLPPGYDAPYPYLNNNPR